MLGKTILNAFTFSIKTIIPLFFLAMFQNCIYGEEIYIWYDKGNVRNITTSPPTKGKFLKWDLMNRVEKFSENPPDSELKEDWKKSKLNQLLKEEKEYKKSPENFLKFGSNSIMVPGSKWAPKPKKKVERPQQEFGEPPKKIVEKKSISEQNATPKVDLPGGFFAKSSDTEVYHIGLCSAAKKIGIDTSVDKITKSEIRERDLRLCKVCQK